MMRSTLGLVLPLLVLSHAHARDRAGYDFPVKDTLKATFIAAIYRPMNLKNSADPKVEGEKSYVPRYLNVRETWTPPTDEKITSMCKGWDKDPADIRRVGGGAPETKKLGTFRFGWNRLLNQPDRISNNKLLIIIPGIGGAWSDSMQGYLEEIALTQGYRPIVPDSPYNPAFIERTSRTGIAGNTRHDTEDLYQGLQWAVTCGQAYMNAEFDQTVNNAVRRGRITVLEGETYKQDFRAGFEVHVLGYSLGALHAGYLSNIDKDVSALAGRKPLFDRLLLINPPLDMQHGLAAIDALKSNDGLIDPYFCMRGSVGTNVHLRDILNSRDQVESEYFRNFLKAGCFNSLTRGQLSGAINFALASSVPSIAKATLNRLYKVDYTRWAAIKPAYQDPKTSDSFQKYLTGIHLPLLSEMPVSLWFSQVNPNETGWFFNNNGLGASRVWSSIQQDERVFLMHNRNDFLLKCSAEQCDIDRLLKGFSHIDPLTQKTIDRTLFYSDGGHLGNIWFPMNQMDIFGVLKGGMGYLDQLDAAAALVPQEN